MFRQHSRIVHHLRGPFDFKVRGRRPHDGNVFRTKRSTCSIRQNFNKDDQVDDASNFEEDWEGGQESETCQTKMAEWVSGDEADE